MGKWAMVPFEEAIIDDTRNATKIKTDEYLAEGQYQIIDQGKDYLAGYTNNQTGLYSDVPVIVFGDHTRVMKYVENPLFIGADGVKLLKVKRADLYPKFVYYFLKSCRIIDTGYNRHFKWLKEINVPLPPLPIQQKIADALDKASVLIEMRKAQIEKLDLLIKSQFIEMFGDPVTNPKGWETMPLAETGTFKNGINFGSNESGASLYCLGVGDFGDKMTIDNNERLSRIFLDKKPSEEHLLKDEDVVFVRSNGNKELVGRCVAVYPGNHETTFSGFCIRYRKTHDSLLIEYLLQVLKASSTRYKMIGRGVNIQNLNQQLLSQLVIPIPPIHLQQEFASTTRKIVEMKRQIEESLKASESFYNSLMQKCFSGEMFA